MGTFGGELWDRAERDGRIKPGRGPLFTRRVYPFRAPMLRKEALRRGMSRRTVDKAGKPARGVILPPAKAYEGPERLGPAGWNSGDHVPYDWDIITRLRAHWLLARDCVGAGWCAAAAHGLPYWADSEKVVLLSPTLRRNASDLLTPEYRQLRAEVRTACVDPLFPELRVVDAPTAAAQCLATILSGKKTWWVPPVPGLTDRVVRAVQFLDAFAQCTHLSTLALLAGARHIVDRRRMSALLELYDLGAQSPMETALRLIVRDELPAGHDWTSQVTVSLTDGTVGSAGSRGKKTTPDLACESLKIALFYDGAHHADGEQTETDFRMFQKLKALGWEAIRVNKELLADLDELLGLLRGTVERAVQAAARPR